MKPKDQTVYRNMLLNCDNLLGHFSWNLGKTKAIDITKGTNDKIGDWHDKSSNKGVTRRWGKTKTAANAPTETNGDTELENETEHLQLSSHQIANFFRPREERHIR